MLCEFANDVASSRIFSWWLFAAKLPLVAGGVPVQEVNRLLKQFEQMQGMMKKMKKGGMAKMMKAMGGMKNLPGMGGFGR